MGAIDRLRNAETHEPAPVPERYVMTDVTGENTESDFILTDEDAPGDAWIGVEADYALEIGDEIR